MKTRSGLASLLILLGLAAGAFGQWPNWGGPRYDFTGDNGPLVEKWPDGGPPVVWSQPIDSGHSSIVLDDGVLYTMCRRGEQDAILALRADTGATLWETRYDAPTQPDMQLEFGPGPHSTPLVAGDRVFALGAMTHLHCLDRHDGKILWKHNLNELLKTSTLLRGYGASPVAYRDLVIVVVAGGDTGVAAFRQDKGELVWKSELFRPGYVTPILTRFNNEDHLIIALGGDRAGLDPATGKTRWKTTVDSQSFGIMSTPLWIPPDKFFCSAGYGGGSRLYQLHAAADGVYSVEILWHYRKMQVAHGTLARIGDVVYGSHEGSFGPAFLMGIDLRDGKPKFRERGLAKANVLLADGKLLILDEQGYLVLARPRDDGLDILAKAQVLEEKAWTTPTLVGTRLYLRDHHTIKCLELGHPAGA